MCVWSKEPFFFLLFCKIKRGCDDSWKIPLHGENKAFAASVVVVTHQGYFTNQNWLWTNQIIVFTFDSQKSLFSNLISKLKENSIWIFANRMKRGREVCLVVKQRLWLLLISTNHWGMPIKLHFGKFNFVQRTVPTLLGKVLAALKLAGKINIFLRVLVGQYLHMEIQHRPKVNNQLVPKNINVFYG